MTTFPSERPSVTLFILAMNEIEGMKTVMPRVNRSWVDQFLVADGQSTSGTQEYAREQGYDVVVQHEKGGRKAFNAAFPWIRRDIVITFRPNGKPVLELPPQRIRTMQEGYDVVIASRCLPPARSDDDTPISQFANWFFTALIGRLFRTVVGVGPLLSIRAARRRLRVGDIPGDEPGRSGGVNRFPKVTGGLAYLVQRIRELWCWK